ncbi:MAG TPA: hypothetical protein VET88_02335 [Gammaproteobacteria bacterium]|nr:hypothetical protein [Gammaproteobacteria bacterium]
MKKFLAFYLLTLLVPATAQAVTITFDDVTTAQSATIPGGYQGYTWAGYDPVADTVSGTVSVATGNSATTSGVYSLGPTLGFQLSRVDGMAFNALDFFAAYENGVTSDLLISGFRNGALTQQITTGLFSSTATSIAVNFPNIDVLRIHALSIDIFSIDNLKLTAVPVPPALWLFVSGLLGLIGMTRNRQAAQAS